MTHKHLPGMIGFTFLLFTTILHAQQNAIITGFVKDAEKNRPIPNASVIIQETTIGAASDSNGYYEIRNIPPGEYLLETIVIGYKNQIRGVTVNQGATVQLDFGLVPLVIEFDKITVAAQLSDPLPTVRLEAKEIARIVPTTTADILREILGVSTSRSGGWGIKPYFQGMTDSRLLVLIDGAKVNQACPLGMDACTATIEPEMIESIEVQKGPGPAQYGSGNMGGVISISTMSSKYNNSPQFRTELSYSGKYKSVSNSRTGLLSFSGGNTKFDFITSFGKGFTDDYQTKKGIIRNSGFNSSSLHLKTRYRPNPNQQILFTTQVYRAEDIGWPASNTIIPEEKRDTYALRYDINNIAKSLRNIEFNLSYQPMYHNMINNLPGDNQFNGESKTNTYNTNLKSHWKLGGRHDLMVGAEYSIWRMNAKRKAHDSNKQSPSINILPNSILGELGVFIQDELKLTEQLRTQIGIRSNYIRSRAEKDTTSVIDQDNLNNAEFMFSGSAALLYYLTNNITLTASLSKGFRPATPVERYIAAPMIDGYYRVGNPDLFSEANINRRFELKGMRNRLNWSIEVYHNSLAKLVSAEIDSEIANPTEGLKGVKRFININKANIVGGSAFIGISITEFLFITANLAYDWGEDIATGKPLPSMAPFQSTTKLLYDDSDKGYWLEFSAKSAAAQNRYSKQSGEKYTPSHTVFIIKGGWKVMEGIELSAGVENIFDNYYRDHLNQAFLPEPGRSAYFTVNLTLPERGMSATRQKKKGAHLHKTIEIRLLVEGMACHFCVNTVRERINGLPGVASTTVTLKEKVATVIIQEGKISLNEIIYVIEGAGFSASLISVESFEKDKYEKR